MNDDPEPTDQSNQPQVYQHKKVITPLNPGIQPEGPSINVARNVERAPSNIVPPPASVNQQPEVEPFHAARYWSAKLLTVFVAAVIGAVITASYFYYWAYSILNGATLLLEHFSPVLLRYALIPIVVLIGIYSLILRFIFRNKHALGQAVFALYTSLLVALGLLAIMYQTGVSRANLFLVLAGVMGGVVFAATNYFAERVWTWRVSRLTLGLLVAAVTTSIVFGFGQYVGHQMATQENQQTASNAQAQKQEADGNYDFNGNYRQFYPNSSGQQRFGVAKIEADDLSKLGYGQDAPNFILLTLQDKTNGNSNVSLWEQAVTPAFKPPNNCGEPDPSLNYIDSQNDTIKPCHKLVTIAGVGTLYGRDQYEPCSCGPQQQQQTAAGVFQWYYLQTGKTLLTIDDTNVVLGTQGAESLIGSLKPISASELLTKSKQLATAHNP